MVVYNKSKLLFSLQVYTNFILRFDSTRCKRSWKDSWKKRKAHQEGFEFISACLIGPYIDFDYNLQYINKVWVIFLFIAYNNVIFPYLHVSYTREAKISLISISVLLGNTCGCVFVLLSRKNKCTVYDHTFISVLYMGGMVIGYLELSYWTNLATNSFILQIRTW